MRRVNIFFITVLILGTFNVFGVTAQNRPTHELHSMMIYNFLKYIQWPDDQDSGDFIITVLGDDDVYNTLNSWYGNKQKVNKSIVVKKAKSAAEIGKSHLLYIGTGSSNQFDAAMTKIDRASTLIITDKKGLGEKGSYINFRVINDRLKFELNQDVVTKSSLKVSSQLAAMAIVI